jgi:glycosyltransferase involved in cell wall biosynthesis
MRVLLLSRYGRLAASSRLRCYQYVPYLERRNISVSAIPLFSDAYVKGIYGSGVATAEIFKSYVQRLAAIRSSSRFDVLWFEKELLPWLPSFIELGILDKRIPVVVDYDDAIFHRYDQSRSPVVRKLLGRKIDRVMQRASVVLAGNDYLAERARAASARNIEIFPTVVDIDRYSVIRKQGSPVLIIGWIGNPGTAKYLHMLSPVLQEISKNCNVIIRAVGAKADQMRGLPVEVKTWSEESETSEVADFDVGIMPLPDEPFERGKCGYKLIQYMACGRPVVASPVGVNRTLVKEGVNGFLASDQFQWTRYLQSLIRDEQLRLRMGRAGRTLVEASYNLKVSAPRLERIFRSLS